MSNFLPKKRLMNIMEEMTGGKSYKSHKYCLDEIQDTSLEYGDLGPGMQWKKVGETRPAKKYVPLFDLSRQVVGSRFFSYFLDGSRHVYKVDDMGFEKSGGRRAIYPVMAGQIGVVCCKRIDKRMKPKKFINEIVVAMPDIADSGGKKPGFWEAMRIKLNESAEMQRISSSGWHFGAVLPYKTSSDDKSFNDKGTALIQNEMMKREQQLVAQLVSDKKLNQNNFLVKDGSLEYLPSAALRNSQHEYAKYKNNYSFVVGVSKRFNPEVCVDIHSKPNPGFIAELPLYHRTPVAYFEDKLLGDIGFAVWYMRIRETRRTQNPFDGIIKVEKVLVTQEEMSNGIESDLANVISAHLINERNPVCFGRDSRWANHLYPIYLTELYAKSRYMSTSTFLHLF